MCTTLEPLFVATKKFQSEQLYMGDFYKIWLELKLAVTAMGASSKVLVDCLQKREEILLENNIVICAVYLDPRIRRVLNIKPECTIRARSHLKHLYLQIHAINNQVCKYFSFKVRYDLT